MIKLSDVSFTYGDEQTTDGVKNISFHAERGECVLFCGVSGSGKSTVLKLINGIIPSFDSGNLNGKICINGRDVSDMPLYERAMLVSSVFQNPKTQFFNIDVESEIVYALENLGAPVDEIERKLNHTVTELQLSKLCGRSMFELSGGEKQQVAFASAYINDTPVVVLDEPSSNLDEEAIIRIRNIMDKMKAQGKTIVIAEHRISYLKGLVDTVYLVENGIISKRYLAEEFFCMADKERKLMGLRCLEKEPLFSKKLSDKQEKSKPVLQIKNLKLAHKKHIIQENISFEGYAGEIIGIVGTNGAGKSTLLRTLGGLNKAKFGEILIDGKRLSAQKRREYFGMVMQDVNYQLFSDSVKGECSLGNPKISETEIYDILSQMSLDNLHERHPQSLSGGQKQRLAIATAYSSEKKILLLDEPTSGLDYRNMLIVKNVLKLLSEKGVLILVVTHDKEFTEIVCDRLISLSGNL